MAAAHPRPHPEDPVGKAVEELLELQSAFTSTELADRLGITRQAVHRHLERRLEEGSLLRTGRGRGTRYSRAASPDRVPTTSHRTEGLREDDVWLDVRAACPELQTAAETPAYEVLQYVVSEFVNNAIDHARADEVRVGLLLDASTRPASFRGVVEDDGLGAFETVRAHFHLADALEALQEISKGRVTTSPENHSGEGLFFSSKAVDHFELEANGVTWLVDNVRRDQATRKAPERPGTRVRFQLAVATERDLTRDVFGAYTTDFRFDRTRAVVKLFAYGTRFVSRSEAKRLARGLDRFRLVTLDFQGVEAVGQGFVDELFRVWARQHPETELQPVHMDEAVEFMVRRGLSRTDLPGPEQG